MRVSVVIALTRLPPPAVREQIEWSEETPPTSAQQRSLVSCSAAPLPQPSRGAWEQGVGTTLRKWGHTGPTSC